MEWHNKWIMDADMGSERPPLVHPQPTNSKTIMCGLVEDCPFFCFPRPPPVGEPASTGLSPTTLSSQSVSQPATVLGAGMQILTSLVICHVLETLQPMISQVTDL